MRDPAPRSSPTLPLDSETLEVAAESDSAAAASGPRRRDSRVRVRAPRVPDEFLAVLEELVHEQLTMTVNVMCVDHIMDGVPPDLSAQAACAAMRARIDDLGELRVALSGLYLLATDPRMRPLLGRDDVLTEYLRGLYTWAKAVLRAFEDAGFALHSLAVDWSVLRARIEDAAPFYFAELEPEVAAAAERLLLAEQGRLHPADPLSGLAAQLALVFTCASRLSVSLADRFG